MTTNLIVRNVEENVALALKRRAAAHGRSTEAEHREILRQALEPEFRCVQWGPIATETTGLVTDIYAQFVFLRIDQ